MLFSHSLLILALVFVLIWLAVKVYEGRTRHIAKPVWKMEKFDESIDDLGLSPTDIAIRDHKTSLAAAKKLLAEAQAKEKANSS